PAPAPAPAPVAVAVAKPPSTDSATENNPAQIPDAMAVKVPVQLDDTYYPTRELDVLPQPSIKVNPAYPAQAVRENLQGWVVLKMKIDYLGRVQSIEVQAADPPGVFDQASLDAFRQVKFEPAQKAGRAVNSLIEIKVRYQMK
ncbi:MAG TPA: energy transducer TonB, partial [Burkholderiales bacterium]|nr:energy transducer TonB [Burkholderiales bacterium]